MYGLEPSNISENKLSWSVTNEDIAIIDKNGNITAKVKGKTTGICQTVNGLKEEFEINVTWIYPKELDIDINRISKDENLKYNIETNKKYEILYTFNPNNVTESEIKLNSQDPNIIFDNNRITISKIGEYNLEFETENGIKVVRTFNVQEVENNSDIDETTINGISFIIIAIITGILIFIGIKKINSLKNK